MVFGLTAGDLYTAILTLLITARLADDFVAKRRGSVLKSGSKTELTRAEPVGAVSV